MNAAGLVVDCRGSWDWTDGVDCGFEFRGRRRVVFRICGGLGYFLSRGSWKRERPRLSEFVESVSENDRGRGSV